MGRRADGPADSRHIESLQVGYVVDAGENGLAARSRRELGYAPYVDAKRISDVDASVRPVLDALQTNPREPLDP